ncbi:hypothetical protein ACFHW2_12065 [Actinomadura sp. LOL_016]|uniref:hypothetical protein n=1 Tax=unclassified Actinomadura TaxID=2626254 RepID=UPI003A7FB308
MNDPSFPKPDHQLELIAALSDGPRLLFTTGGTNPEIHLVDGDMWDPHGMAPRNRAICRALLQHALAKVDAADAQARSPLGEPRA